MRISVTVVNLACLACHRTGHAERACCFSRLGLISSSCLVFRKRGLPPLLSKFGAGSYTDGVHRRGAASPWKYIRGLVIVC